MEVCELVDYSERPESLIKLYEFPSVTAEDLAAIKAILPDQLAKVCKEDYLTIYIVDNRTDGIKGLLMIWHRKGKACFDTGDGNVWGDWEEGAKLVVTEEFEGAKDHDGMEVMGRIAYNTHGMRGIYSQRRFFTLIDYAMEATAI